MLTSWVTKLIVRIYQLGEKFDGRMHSTDLYSLDLIHLRIYQLGEKFENGRKVWKWEKGFKNGRKVWKWEKSLMGECIQLTCNHLISWNVNKLIEKVHSENLSARRKVWKVWWENAFSGAPAVCFIFSRQLEFHQDLVLKTTILIILAKYLLSPKKWIIFENYRQIDYVFSEIYPHLKFTQTAAQGSLFFIWQGETSL